MPKVSLLDIVKMKHEIGNIVDAQREKAKAHFGNDIGGKLRFSAFCLLMGDLSKLDKPVKKLVIEALQSQVDYSDNYVPVGK